MSSIQEIMTTDVATIGPASTVKEAILKLEDYLVRHLPVVDEEGRLVGMLSDRDLREYRVPILEEIENPDGADRLLETPISEVMTGLVVSADQGESVGALIRLMLEYGVGAVPIVDRTSQELVGIVSYVDILRLVKDDFE